MVRLREAWGACPASRRVTPASRDVSAEFAPSTGMKLLAFSSRTAPQRVCGSMSRRVETLGSAPSCQMAGIPASVPLFQPIAYDEPVPDPSVIATPGACVVAIPVGERTVADPKRPPFI